MKLYTLSIDKYYTFIHIMDDIRDYQILRLELYSINNINFSHSHMI